MYIIEINTRICAYDTLTLPDDILNKLSAGEWTVSVKGKPYSNQAIDEAHESVINRRMKQITSRPSAFRTVELADFMSYLDSVLLQFEEYVFQHNAEPNSHHKKIVLERKSLIKDLILINHISFFEVDVVVTHSFTKLLFIHPSSYHLFIYITVHSSLYPISI